MHEAEFLVKIYFSGKQFAFNSCNEAKMSIKPISHPSHLYSSIFYFINCHKLSKTNNLDKNLRRQVRLRAKVSSGVVNLE